jgi:hypothetical protein
MVTGAFSDAARKPLPPIGFGGLDAQDEKLISYRLVGPKRAPCPL